MISKLEAVERGESRRLLLFLPPRHGKSMTGTQLFPAWYLGRHPNRSVITATYAQELSDDFGRRVKNLVTSPLHQAIFPGCRLSGDSASMRRFSTTAGGSYYAVGRGGPITGRGCDLLLLDDPIKDREEANSETIRRALHEWYSHVAYTRLQPGGAIVLIETRWHMDDLAGWLLREHLDERWEVVSLPAIAETDEDFRKVGSALWPERFPLLTLEQIRSSVGSAAWASLYQQRPAAAEGAIFQRAWWQFYQPPLSIHFTRRVQSWDTAFKGGAENDYSVCTTWGVAEGGYYLLHLWRGRVEFPRLKQIFLTLAGEWKPSAILVEDRASGQSLIQELKAGTSLPVLAVKVDTDKVTRAQAVTPLIESGKVFVPSGASWLADFLDELATFPAGVHDDCVDSVTQALNYLRERGSALAEFLARSVAKMREEAKQKPAFEPSRPATFADLDRRQPW
jgi:predicted phage terminase large subunit-like protein